MKPLPKIHDIYIGKVVLTSVLGVWLVLAGLDFVLGGGGLMAQLDDLGKGSYGSVYLATHRVTNDERAVKVRT